MPFVSLPHFTKLHLHAQSSLTPASGLYLIANYIAVVSDDPPGLTNGAAADGEEEAGAPHSTFDMAAVQVELTLELNTLELSIADIGGQGTPDRLAFEGQLEGELARLLSITETRLNGLSVAGPGSVDDHHLRVTFEIRPSTDLSAVGPLALARRLALLLNSGFCTDFPEWVDIDGDSCYAYNSCVDGVPRAGQDYTQWAVGGVSALDACCRCGGGGRGTLDRETFPLLSSTNSFELVGDAAALDVVGESGSVVIGQRPCAAQESAATCTDSLEQAGLKLSWVTVTTQRIYRKPVVLTGPPTSTGSSDIVVRVRNVGRTSFQLALQSPRCTEPGVYHVPERIGWLVLESGSWYVGGGDRSNRTVLLEAGVRGVGTGRDRRRWHHVSFSAEFAALAAAQHAVQASPLVLSQVQSFIETETGPAWSHVRNAESEGFDVTVDEEWDGCVPFRSKAFIFEVAWRSVRAVVSRPQAARCRACGLGGPPRRQRRRTLHSRHAAGVSTLRPLQPSLK
eukprot:SAG11_NODE_2178_length_3714_cov_4.224343_2_plen_510_part_00